MTSAAEQYRALVQRLERINSSEIISELKIGDIDPKNGKKILSAMTDGSGNVVRSGTGEIWNVKYGEPDKAEEPAPTPTPTTTTDPTPTPAEPEVTPTPTPAEPEVTPTPTPTPEPQPAEKCGPDVKEKIKQQKSFAAAFKMAREAECQDFIWCQIVRVPGQAPTPKPQPVQGVTTNPMGDFDPTAFSGDFTGGTKREDMELEEAAFIPGSEEIDRVREIAGTQIIEQNIADMAREQGLQMGKPKDPNTKCSACGRTYTQHVNPDGSSKVRHPFFFKEGPGQAATPNVPPKTQDASPGTIPEIKASTKEKAIEIARKKGIKVFRFCGKYGTKLGKKPKDAPTPKPKPQPVQGVTTNPMGDFDPTDFSGDFTGGTKR